MNASATCYTIVHDDLVDAPTSQELRNALQKGSDEVKLETMRMIIVGTLNGQSHVGISFHPSLAPIDRVMLLAHSTYAHHPICDALAKQADQEDAPFLLGVSVIVCVASMHL